MGVLWASDTEKARHIINVAAFVQFQSNVSPEEFIAAVKEKIKKTKDVRYNSSLHNMLGYWYRMRSDTVLDKAIILIPLTQNELDNKSDFEKRISRIESEPLPKHSVIEILISSEPVTFYENNDGSKTHAAIIRLHHTVGEGFNLLAFLLSIADDQIITNHISGNSEVPLVYKNVTNNSRLISSKNIFSDVVKSISEVTKNASVYYFGLIKPYDNNILHKSTLSGEKILVSRLEKDSEYFLKIKSIKSRVEQCTFSDVVHTAVSASLWEHFNKYAKPIPRNITMTFVATVKNGSFCAIVQNLPIHIDGTKSASEKLLQRLNIIKASRKNIRQSLDALIFYWLASATSLLPTPIVRLMVRCTVKATVSLSNLPGIRAITINGQLLRDIVFWTPNVALTGVGLTMLTYDNRIQAGLVADKTLLSSREDAVDILQSIFKYLDLLEEEIKLKND
ncbi:hypothetical protein AMK59_4461 [Oryctes borbonicus]|uniref:O-acyltransferase WSD1 C-terminal domain-containing protein n=1 Tax=Oryctes borbonicus TaxID=1629725 RepID=A0A0T6B4Y2_9SCAR|nr:hypothetical protein AMK59_4461 [Oryctes borbonicus]